MYLLIYIIIFIILLFVLSHDEKIVNQIKKFKLPLIILIIYLGVYQQYNYILFILIILIIFNSNLKSKINKEVNFDIDSHIENVKKVIQNFIQNNYKKVEENFMNIKSEINDLNKIENKEEDLSNCTGEEFDEKKKVVIEENNMKYNLLKNKFDDLENKIKSLL